MVHVLFAGISGKMALKDNFVWLTIKFTWSSIGLCYILMISPSLPYTLLATTDPPPFPPWKPCDLPNSFPPSPPPPPGDKRITGFNIQPYSDLAHYLTVNYVNVDDCLQTKGEYKASSLPTRGVRRMLKRGYLPSFERLCSAGDPLESYSPSWSLFGLETQQAGDLYVWNRTLPYNNHRLVSPNLVLSLVFLLF